MIDVVRFNDLVADSAVFQAQFPQPFHQLLEHGLPEIPDPEDKRLTEFMFRKAQGCFNNGSEAMRSYIYLRWIASRQQIRADDVWEFTAPSLETLPQEDQALWQRYLNEADLRQGLRGARAFQKGVTSQFYIEPFYETPVKSEEALEVCGNIRRVPFEIAVKVFPGMTDLEASMIFGGMYDPDRVRRNALGLDPRNWTPAQYREQTATNISVFL